MCGHALNVTVHERLDRIEERIENSTLPDTQAALLESSIRQTEMLMEMGRNGNCRVAVEADARYTPEMGLLKHLYSYLPSRTLVVLDPDYDSALLCALGYQVVPVFPTGGGLSAAESPEVDGALVPGSLDHSSLRALSARRAHLIVLRSTASRPDYEPVNELRAAGYPWSVVIHPTADGPAFYSNSADGPHGTFFFFKDFSLFSQAQTWCAAVLRRTLFAPAQVPKP